MSLKKAQLIEKKQLTHDVVELTFVATEPFEFQAGQFLTIKIANKMPPIFRAYSFSTKQNEDKRTFGICFKIVPGGRSSVWLNNLEIGNEIEFIGPSGKFTFKTPNEKNVLFVGTGTGITPLKSMLEDELAKNTNQKFHLIFGVRHVKDLFYQDFFENLAQKYSNFTFQSSLSQPEEQWTGNTGRVTAQVEKLSFENPSEHEVYICGLKKMIENVTEILKEKGLPQEAIHFEKYD